EGRILRVPGDEVEVEDEIMRNGFAKVDPVDLPNGSVREHHPLDAVVGSVIDRLAKMVVSQVAADRLHLDQKGDPCVGLNREVDVGAADLVLGGDVEERIPPENVGKNAFDDRNRVRLIDVSRLRRLED